MALKKYVRKGIKNAGRVVKRRYFKGKGYNNPKVSQMAKDIMFLKNTINAEKKVFQQYLQNALVGQVSANLNGYYFQDITPNPAQGTTSITRTGNSIKHHSSYIQFQFSQQSAVVSPVRLKIYLIRVVGQSILSPSGTVPQTMFDPNPFISGGSNIYDYNSNRNQDFFQTYKVLACKNVYLAPDNVSGQLMIKNVKMGMKYRDKWNHVKFSTDGSTAIAAGQLILMIVADSGNISTTTASTLTGIPVTAVNTGLTFQMNAFHYFYDN